APPAPPVPSRTARQTQIVAAARALLDHGGWSAVTARAVADRLGIKAPSLYKHVGGLDDIRVALLTDALVESGTRLHAAVAQDPTVASVARAYRDLARSAPHLYRLATVEPLARDALPDGLEEWAGSPFWLVTGDPVRAQALWAWCHGMAILEIDDRFPPGSPLDQTWAVGAAAFAS
ncbi:TetR/AcrR family transcriptional regulator, partial [Arsenicicoccus bolidensis]